MERLKVFLQSDRYEMIIASVLCTWPVFGKALVTFVSSFHLDFLQFVETVSPFLNFSFKCVLWLGL